MTNFYSELKLSPDLSIEEIKSELLRLEQVWRKREINSPETATAKLALINEAKKVFASSSSKATYDRELENSQRKPVASDPQRDRYAQWKKWYDTAMSYMEEEQYDLAKSSIEKALTFFNPDEDNAEFFADIAEVYRKNRDYASAFSYINKALIINVKEAKFHLLKSMICSSKIDEMDTFQKNSNERFELEDHERKCLYSALKYAELENNSSLVGIVYSRLSWSFYRHFWEKRESYIRPLLDSTELWPLPKEFETALNYAEKTIEYGDSWGIGQKIIEHADDICLRRKPYEDAQKFKTEIELKKREKKKAKLVEQERLQKIRAEKEKLDREKRKQTESRIAEENCARKQRVKEENRRLALERQKKKAEEQQKIAEKQQRAKRKESFIRKLSVGITILAIIAMVALLFSFIRETNYLRKTYATTGVVDQGRVRIGSIIQYLIIIDGYVLCAIIGFINYLAARRNEAYRITAFSVILGLISTWIVSVFVCGLTGKLQHFTRILTTGAVWKTIAINQIVLIILIIIARAIGKRLWKKTVKD